MLPDVPYRFTIRPLAENEGGGYLIEFPVLPGCRSDGATIEEAITNGLDAMRGWIDAIRAEGHPIPASMHAEPLGVGGRRYACARSAK
jgi:antitoxin HicB